MWKIWENKKNKKTLKTTKAKKQNKKQTLDQPMPLYLSEQVNIWQICQSRRSSVKKIKKNKNTKTGSNFAFILDTDL